MSRELRRRGGTSAIAVLLATCLSGEHGSADLDRDMVALHATHLDASGQMVEYALREGNRVIANILSAARAGERAVAEAAKRGINATVRDIPTEAEGEQ